MKTRKNKTNLNSKINRREKIKERRPETYQGY